MEDFFQMVTRTFAFLVDKYGFALTSGQARSSLDSITYEKKPVTIAFGWYKGEIDIDFCIDLENDVFRPYLSRTFHLSEIALRQNKNAYRDGPQFPNYITTPADAEAALQFEASIMRKYCKPILRGDISILEEITRTRQGRAR